MNLKSYLKDKLIVSNKKIINEHLIEKSEEVVLIDDARSATFYCLGLSQIEKKKVVLLTDEIGLSSCYTGIMEAFFQKIGFDIIVFGEKIPDLYKKFTNIYINEQPEKEDGINLILITEVGVLEEKHFLCEMTIEDLNKLKPYKITSNIELTSTNENLAELECEIGCISRYIGNIQISPYVLICSIEDLYNEINVFNCRYINKNFKIVVVGNKNDKSTSIEDWLCENGFSIFSEMESLMDFVGSDRPSVLFVD